MKDRIYNSGLYEELMAVMFHPDNVHKFAGWGFEDMVPDGAGLVWKIESRCGI